MKQRLAIAVPVLMALMATLAIAQNPSEKDGQMPKPAKGKVGLTLSEPGAYQGYTMFSKLLKTYLIDMQGRVVRVWDCDCEAGMAYLLPNGHLLRSGKITEKLPFDQPPGLGGRIQEYTWEGKLIWDFQLASAKGAQHHDICPLPNGNVLCVAWDRRTAKEVLDAGRVESLVGDMLPDSVIELKKKTGKTEAEVVWQWRIWDHLIQDYDKAKANYGPVAAHPELVNINFGGGALAGLPASAEGLQKLKGTDVGKKGRVDDWTHVNAISYNAELDQILLSSPQFNEIWIIDHSTTTAEAVGHTGGKGGKGGDLLYRWGNPQAYRAGKPADQQLFGQHNAHWIPKGVSGAGHIMVFNNGRGRPGGNYSSVEEIVPPLGPDGKYAHQHGTAFGPPKPAWTFTTAKKTDFYASFISSAQRLPNGNTFICAGDVGRFFEATPKTDVVWQYINPVDAADVGGAPGSPNMTFRAYRYSPDHPGLAGKDLTPGKTIEEMLATKDGK